MSKKNSNEKKYTFRRINGRVVPIAIGVTSISSGLAVGSKKVSRAYDKRVDKYIETVGSGKFKQRKVNFFTGNNEISKLNNFYNKVLTKTSDGTFFGNGIGKFDPLEKRHGSIPKNSYKIEKYRVSPREGRAYAFAYTGKTGVPIHTNLKNIPVMLHEIGHRKQVYGKGSSVYKFFKKVQKVGNEAWVKDFRLKNRGSNPEWKDYSYFKGNIRLDKIKRKIASKSSYYAKRIKYKSIDKSLMQIRRFGKFAVEMDANYSAIKMAKKIRGKKFAKITAKVMVPNVLAYGKSGIIKSTKYGLIGAGAYSVYRGINNN